uniref:Replication factor A C-terminal domain-containing protein n=2 Tax=Leptobrachium leishanense TaxID=445787 RepID=A0A8C5M2W9_9ANUR
MQTASKRSRRSYCGSEGAELRKLPKGFSRASGSDDVERRADFKRIPGTQKTAEQISQDFMNGIHRFLIATVLSVQDSSFTYAACHNCFSRVICSARRYECPRCGYTSKEPIHRYKVSLKVADGRQLYIITVFGRCLDQVFGTSAPALLRRIQDVMKMPSELRRDGAQELLFQALQYCFIGRSFLFGVKVPAGDRDSSRRLSFQGSPQHMIALHVSLPNRDSVGCTVLQHFEELLQSFLSGHHTPDRTLSPTGKTSQIPDVSCLTRSLGGDGGTEEGQQAVDWWQKSLGLTFSSSSRLSNSPAEASLHEVDKSSEWVSFDKGPNSDATSHSDPEHVRSCILSIPSTSTPKPADAHQRGNNTTMASQPPGDVTGSFFPLKDPPDGPSNSKTAHERENHRLSTWSYADRTCQDHVSPSKNAATAGTHQTVAEEDWEDFLFSESLSELITKAEKEDSDAQRSCKTHKRGPNTGANLKSPQDHAFPCQWNAASGRDMADEADTLLRLPDGYTSTSQKSVPLLLNVLAQASENPSTSPPLKPEDTLGSPPALNLSLGSRENPLSQPFGFKLNENRCIRKDGGGIVFPLSQSVNCPEIWVSYQGETTDLKESGFSEGLLQTHFNTSADLFETSGTLSVTAVEDSPTLCNISTGVDCTAKDKPCSPVSIVPATEDLSQAHDFASGFYSTPVLKQIARPRPLRLNKNLLNVSVSGTGGLLSSRRTPCQSMRNDLLKKMACSFLEGHTASSRAVNMSSGNSDLTRFVFHPGSSERTSSSPVVKSETRRAGLSRQGRTFPVGKTSPMDLIDGQNSRGQLGFGHEVKIDSESNSSNLVNRDQTDGFISESLDLSPVPLAATSETNSVPNDWSPELFAEKSNIYHQNESLQRRLF